MKKFLASFVLSTLCVILSAQEKVDFMNIISDVCNKNSSSNIFLDKHKDQLIDYKEEDKSNFALNVNFAGFESTCLITFVDEGNTKAVGVVPNFETFDSLARYTFAKTCHKYMITKFGNPIKEEPIIFETPEQQEIANALNIKSGTTYTWSPGTGFTITGSLLKTDKEDRYSVQCIYIGYFADSTPFQRKFFKTLELGLPTDKGQIASALRTSIYKLVSERTSSGEKYTFRDNIYFGGIEWSFVELTTVGNKFASITFTDTELRSNKAIYDSLLEVLSKKYGKPNIADNTAYWNSVSTMINLSYIYCESKGGEMRHYVTLNYLDTILFLEQDRIINDEL